MKHTNGSQTSLDTNPQPMVKLADGFAPKFPTQVNDVGIDPDVISGLALKHAHTVPKFSTEWMIRKLSLPLPIVTQILDSLRDDHMIEVVGHSGPFGYTYTATSRGQDLAKRLMEISGYVGPTPVSLEAYSACLECQLEHLPAVDPLEVKASVSSMVIPEQIQEIGGLAIMSRRSLFLYGPPGNGKTTLGHLLHNATRGDIWIPYAIGIENEVIRVYDPECHELAETDSGQHDIRIDARWVRIKRPFIVVGGELTLKALDLIHDQSHGYYEAPLHFKANGGTFLLDDFGCQQVSPQDLLNRWIHPLERGVDFLTLKTGQQLEVPFRQMLIVSTNMDPDRMMSPAFLRRMGYRVFMPNPSPETYTAIFEKYAKQSDAEVSQDLLSSLLSRYDEEERPLRSCEPRDLIERARDICRYRGDSLHLTTEVLDVAWRGYFGYDDAVAGQENGNGHANGQGHSNENENGIGIGIGIGIGGSRGSHFE